MDRKKYRIEIIRVDETQHNHLFHKTNNLFAEIKDKNEEGKEITIKVEPKDLYEVKLMEPFKFLRWALTGTIQKYIMIVNSNGVAIREKKPKVSGKVLKVARDWRGLGKAINDSFGTRFDIPRVGLVVLVVGAIAVLFLLVKSGYIPLPRSW